VNVTIITGKESMASKKKSNEEKGPTTLEDKVRKLAGDETTDAIKGSSKDELEKRLVTLAQHEAETVLDLEKNEDIVEMREKVKLEKHDLKEMEAPYKDTLKSIAVQRIFISEILESQGS
jgi:hypothetical protein